jgi:hypothetical protein
MASPQESVVALLTKDENGESHHESDIAFLTKEETGESAYVSPICNQTELS